MSGGELLLMSAYMILIRRHIDNLDVMMREGNYLTAQKVAELLVNDVKRLQELIGGLDIP